jgi:hypothetical protein
MLIRIRQLMGIRSTPTTDPTSEHEESRPTNVNSGTCTATEKYDENIGISLRALEFVTKQATQYSVKKRTPTKSRA